MAILSHLLFGIRGPERKVGHQYVKSVAACAIEMGSGSVEKSYKSWVGYIRDDATQGRDVLPWLWCKTTLSLRE